MRIKILFLFGLIFSFSFAQEFVNEDYKVIPGVFYHNSAKYTNLRHNLQNLKCDGGYCSYGESYKKVVYTIGNTSFYTPNVTYKSNDDLKKKGIYYLENNQLYYKSKVKTANSDSEPIYHANGNFYNGPVADPGDKGLTRFVEIDKNGLVIADSPYRRPFYKAKKDPVYGKKAPIHHVKTPSTYGTNEGFRYYGFDEVAYIADYQSHQIFTGFVFPLTSYLTNGSVLYMEDKITKKNYWTVILDGEVKFKMEAPEKDAPDIFLLKNNTTFEHNKLIGQVPYKFTKNLTNKYLQYHDIQQFVLKTKNLENHNGYGINLYTSDRNVVADEIFCEVGQFKNGKLNGVGLRSSLVKKYKAEFSWSTPSLTRQEKDYITMDVSYGVFENGKPVKVKTINVENMSPYNFWDEINIAGFKYKGGGRGSGFIPKNSVVDITQLAPGNEVYIEEIGRTATINKVDKNLGFFTVYTDVKDIKAKFDATYQKPLYLKNTLSYKLREDCPKTEKIPIYRKEKVLAYTMPGTVKYSSYTVTGLYFDKIVTTKTSTPPIEIYKYEDHLDHYETHTCSKCKGKGYNEVQSGHTEWKKINLK